MRQELREWEDEIVQRLGLKRLRGRARRYRSPDGSTIYLKLSSRDDKSPEEESHYFFGLPRRHFEVSTFTVLVCGYPTNCFVFPTRSADHKRRRLEGLSELLDGAKEVGRGLGEIKANVWLRGQWSDNGIPECSMTVGTGKSIAIDQYWERFDLIGGARW